MIESWDDSVRKRENRLLLARGEFQEELSGLLAQRFMGMSELERRFPADIRLDSGPVGKLAS